MAKNQKELIHTLHQRGTLADATMVHISSRDSEGTEASSAKGAAIRHAEKVDEEVSLY